MTKLINYDILVIKYKNCGDKDMEDPRGWILVMIIWAIMEIGPFIIGTIICIIILRSESKKKKKIDSSKRNTQ